MLLTNSSFCHNFLIRRPFFEPFAALESGGRAISSRSGSNQFWALSFLTILQHLVLSSWSPGDWVMVFVVSLVFLVFCDLLWFENLFMSRVWPYHFVHGVMLLLVFVVFLLVFSCLLFYYFESWELVGKEESWWSSRRAMWYLKSNVRFRWSSVHE